MNGVNTGRVLFGGLTKALANPSSILDWTKYVDITLRMQTKTRVFLLFTF